MKLARSTASASPFPWVRFSLGAKSGVRCEYLLFSLQNQYDLADSGSAISTFAALAPRALWRHVDVVGQQSILTAAVHRRVGAFEMPRI